MMNETRLKVRVQNLTKHVNEYVRLKADYESAYRASFELRKLKRRLTAMEAVQLKSATILSAEYHDAMMMKAAILVTYLPEEYVVEVGNHMVCLHIDAGVPNLQVFEN